MTRPVEEILAMLGSVAADLAKLADHNPGAYHVLASLFAVENLLRRMTDTLREHNIRGPAIWVLYKNVCHGDIHHLAALLLRNPDGLARLAVGTEEDRLKAETDDWHTAEAMMRFGGSFVKLLGEMARTADATHLLRLKEAFPEYFAKYSDPMWKVAPS